MEMEVFPALELGVLNGWILLCIWLIIQGLSVLVLPRDVRSRLFEFDRSSWSKNHRVLFALGKILGLVFLIMAALTAIDLDTIEFLIGLGMYILGVSGLISALHSFGSTPLDQPVTGGLYKYSRHPQLFTLLVIGVGIGVALGSWILLLLRVSAFALEHAGVIAEENECVRRFGESYKEYMDRVPQYFLI